MNYELYFEVELPISVAPYIQNLGYQTFYEDATYCVRKEFGGSIEKSREERLSREEYATFLSGVVYRFKENFAKTKGKNIGNIMMHIKEYEKEISSYLTQVPFCFMSYPEVHFYDEKMVLPFLLDLYKVPVDQRSHLFYEPAFVDENIDTYPVSSVSYDMVSLKDVVGSTVPKYAKTSFFEIMSVMRSDMQDKSLWDFIVYIIQNRIFESPYAMDLVMHGVCAEEVDGKIYIVEGNHRVCALKILYLIERSLKDPLAVEEKYRVPMQVTHRLRLEKNKAK